ncbi:MAG: BspA family leucine-rich repeat surface protein [Erysipelotrichaceae bacterium]|nr:BspA family leucine-rich repeat surface protein [Erysipelotrichaceae bacterium]
MSFLNVFVSLFMYIIYAHQTTPCDDSYIIEIPRTVDLSETQTFQITVVENDLLDNQILHIDMPDEFTLSDSHGRDDINGTLSGNHITYGSDDLSSRTISCQIPSLPAGNWSSQLPITIQIETIYPSNLMISGPCLNQILRQVDPHSITFTDEDTGLPMAYDVSMAQDESVLLYIDHDDVIISNHSQSPIIVNENMAEAFSELSSLTSIDGLDHLDFSSCNDIHSMFSHDHLLADINGLSSIDTSSVCDMSYLFADTRLLTSLDLNSWNMANVEDISHMFEDSKVTSLSINSWNTGNISDMSYLFHDCSEITNIRISNWNTASVIDMTSMFEYCSKLKTLSLGSFNVSSCTSLRNMFAGSTSLTTTGTLDLWDLNSCEDLSGIFDSCSKLRNIGDLSSWDTSSVKDMSKMFRGCMKLSGIGDISSWDVSKCQSFAHMFANTSELSNVGDLSLWDISDQCVDLSYMFQNSSSLLPSSFDLSGWDVSNVTDMSHMFENSHTLNTLDISDWDTGNLMDMSYMFAYNETGSLSPLSQITGIDSINTSSLENISNLFYEDQYLNCDLSLWDTSSLRDISYAFYGTYRFDIDKLKHWNVSSVIDMSETFGDNAGSLISSPVPDWYH